MTSVQTSFKMEYVPSIHPLFSTNSAHSSTQFASPQFASRLLRLPGEIRNRIYYYVFTNQDVLLIKDSHGTIKLECINGWYKYTALTRTCRQIHKETRLLPSKYCNYLLIAYSRDYLRWMELVDQELCEIVKANLNKEDMETLLY